MDLDTTAPLFDAGTSAPADTGATPPAAPAAPAPEPTYEIKVGDQTVKVSLDELKRGYLRQSDYTRKTTEHAEQLRNLQRYEQAMGRVREFLGSPDHIRDYYQKTFGQQLAEAGQDAIEAGADPADVRQLIAQLRQELRQEFAQGLTQLQTETLGSDYKRTIDGHVERVLQSHPELSGAFGPRAALALKQLVASSRPKSLQEAVQLIEEEARGLADNLKGWSSSQLKSTVAPGAPNALSRGIEPPRSGAPPESAPQRTFKKVSDPELRAQVMADLERMAAQGS